MSARSFFALTCMVVLTGCAGWGARIGSRPGLYEVMVREVHAAHGDIHPTYVRPDRNRHSGYLVIFITGDEGWFATSRAVFMHLVDEGYTLVGFSAPELVRGLMNSERVGTKRAAQGLKELYAKAKQHLGLAKSTPIVMVGFSRGASVVAFTAVNKNLRHGLKGGVAIALTREADYLDASEDERRLGFQLDDQDRIELYPTLKFLGPTPLAIIQSTNDAYVPSAESRQLLGPDTPTLRLYQVKARDHGFSNARDKLMDDLDDALQWIEESGGAVRSTAPEA